MTQPPLSSQAGNPPSTASRLLGFSQPTERVLLGISGADRHRFLNGFVTAEVKNRGVGESFLTFFTNVKGRVLAEGYGWVAEQVIYLEVLKNRAEFLVEHLEKYIIADRVEIRIEPWLALRLWGGEVHHRVQEETELNWKTEGSARDFPFIDLSERLNQPTVTFWGSPDAVEYWGAQFQKLGIPRLSSESIEACRIESGFPKWGVDYDESNFPQESGLEAETVSYEKGCYLGQEIVARIHYRGGVQRRMVRVDLKDAVQAGQAVEVEERVVGKLTSVVKSAEGGWTALALLQLRGADPGTVLHWSGGRGVVTDWVGSSDPPKRIG